MEKILGIDTGTNSLGWAIVEKNEQGEYRLTDKGVNIFQEGVKIEKGIESSKAADRSGHKATRVRYYRIKLRKLRLLRVMIDHHLCPPLTTEELTAWRLRKIYPKNELFMHWQATDDRQGKNPYADRHRCLHETLDMNDLADRYTLGRALYHMAQRRGFLSNRKDQDGEDQDGKVKGGISQLTTEMHEAGFEYLGDYFFHLYNKGEKIRCHYTARNEHYLNEFHAICERQHLDKQLTEKLEKAIFHQRPLKSQKGQVGHCLFEKNKTKCPTSHPRFEEFRMLQFVNGIKIQTPADSDFRPLNEEERKKACSKFYRKSKPNFNFEDIAKEIAGKDKYAFKDDKAEKPVRFNYYKDTPVSGCPVTAGLRDIFGDDWEDAVCEVYTLAKNKSRQQIVSDVWHVLYSFSDEKKLVEFATNRLQLSADDAKKFSKIKVRSDYASLSLKAICKILPYLRRGIIYSHAVFLGNLCEVLPAHVWGIREMREAAVDRIIQAMDEYSPTSDAPTLETCVKGFIHDEYGVSYEELTKLYHPSMIETYPHAQPNNEGIYQLGSPRISSVRNPMAMRSLFRMRHLVNILLRQGRIDEHTTIHIEFARELNDANMRKAIADQNRTNLAARDKARKAIAELYKKETGAEITPTDDDVRKYLLWEEQKHICLYTGRQIGIADFIGPNPKFDIEHTIPRSVGGDTTRENLTLCDSHFNRNVKKAQLPSQLANHEEILARIAHWKEQADKLGSRIRAKKLASKAAATKDAKDKIIQDRHTLELERGYWLGKYKRFTMTEVPEGFSRRQGTDISVISRYARLYLKSVFQRVFTVKGIATSDFRKIWGIQDVYAKKQRTNHVHHAIDAIVIACLGPDQYNQLAAYYHDEENSAWYGKKKGHIPAPWPTFAQDIKRVQDEILVYHHTPDNMAKQGRRHICIGGKKVLAKGDAARGSLHLDTYYGAIDRDGEVRYVVRRDLASLSTSDVKNIVDDTVREKVEAAIKEHGTLVKAVEATVWMNREKQVPIRKVRCYAGNVTNPLNIRQQRDRSTKDYKRQFHVANDRNYMMALYVGHDKKGREKRDFELLNMLDAAAYYKTSNDKDAVGHSIVPTKSRKDNHDYPLACTLKIGTNVLLYENSPEEVWEATVQERSKRLYTVSGMSSMTVTGNTYGTINFVHHEEARQSKDIKAKNGAFKQGEDYRPAIKMLHTQIKALVQGYDFEIDELGEIKRLR